MNQAKTIINWYREFDKNKHDVEDLLKARQKLSVELRAIGQRIGEIQLQLKPLVHERKIMFARKKLKSELKTVAERDADAYVQTEEIRMTEGSLDGELEANKIFHSDIREILNSMSSWINTLNNR